MSRRFNRWFGWIVDRPLLAWFCVLLISGIAIIGYTAPALVTDLGDLFSTGASDETTAPRAVEQFEQPPDVESVSLTGGDAILVVESDSIFTPDGAKALRKVVSDLESLDHVRPNILWMDRIPILNIFGLSEPLFPRGTASETRYAAAKEKALAHPLVGGQLLSEDGRTLLMMIHFDRLWITSNEDCTTRLREVAEAAVADFPNVKFKFTVTGRLPIWLMAIQSHEANSVKYQLIGYGMICVMAVILFRGISAVFIVGLAPVMGVFWTLGFLNFFDFNDNPFNDVVLPVLLSLVGLTDGVHLMVQIRRRRAEGLSAKDAARTGIHEVGLACGLTSLTTAIGFGSLSLAHHEIVREFGYCCVIGVILTFLSVVTLIPLVCSTRLGQRIHIGHDKGLVDKNLNRIGGLVEFVLARTKLMSVVALVGTTVLLLVSLTLKPDEKRYSALPMNSEAARGLRLMDKSMRGMESSRVDIRWDKTVAADSADVLAVVRKVDKLLNTEELIGHPISIANLLDALPGSGVDADRMSMLDLLPPPLKRAFYTPEYRTAIVQFRVQDLGIAKYSPVFERVEAGLAEMRTQHPNFQLELNGPAVGHWRDLYQIVVDLAASLGSATIIIFIVLALVYRSLRIGLISLVPNIFPLAVTGTYLVCTGQSLELVSVCAFTVCLGIAVDDTIHFLTRFTEESQLTSDRPEAIRRAFTAVGTALIMTTIVLVAGFSTVMFSDSRDHHIFASMGGLTIAAALFGDLVFLPALLARFAPATESNDIPKED